MAWRDQQLNVRTDDEIIISLPEDRSTGYRWSILSADSSPRRSATQPPPPFANDNFQGWVELAMTDPKAEPRRKPPSQAVDRARKPAPAEENGATSYRWWAGDRGR